MKPSTSRQLFLSLPLLLAIPGTAMAGADSGFYIGGGVGDASVDTGNFDESDSAYKVLGGFNFGLVPFIDLAVEGSYVDFGKAESGNNSVEVSGVDAFGLAGLSFGPFGIFAKYGFINWEADATFAGNTSSSDGTDPAYGLGARFALGSLQVRAEYEFFDLDQNTDIEMLSISGVFTF